MSDMVQIILIDADGTHRSMEWGTPLPSYIRVPFKKPGRGAKDLSEDEPIPIRVFPNGDIVAFPMDFDERTYRRKGDTLEYGAVS